MRKKDKVYSYGKFVKVLRENIKNYELKYEITPDCILVTKEQRDIIFDALDGIVFPSIHTLPNNKVVRSYRGLPMQIVRDNKYNGVVL